MFCKFCNLAVIVCTFAVCFLHGHKLKTRTDKEKGRHCDYRSLCALYSQAGAALASRFLGKINPHTDLNGLHQQVIHVPRLVYFPSQSSYWKSLTNVIVVSIETETAERTYAPLCSTQPPSLLWSHDLDSALHWLKLTCFRNMFHRLEHVLKLGNTVKHTETVFDSAVFKVCHTCCKANHRDFLI